MFSLRYEDHSYAKLFHHLISLHCHDHEICWVWWKHGLEIRIKSNTWRLSQWRWRWLGGGFIFFDSKARVKKWSKREKAKATLKHPQKRLLNSSSLSQWLLKNPGPQFLSSTNYMPKRTTYNELCQISPNTQNQWNPQDPYWYNILRHKRLRRIKYRHNTY